MILYLPANLDPFEFENGLPRLSEEQYGQYLKNLRIKNYTKEVILLSKYKEYRVIMPFENQKIDMTIGEFLRLNEHTLRYKQNKYVRWTLPNLITEDQLKDIENIEEKEYNKQIEFAKRADEIIQEYIGEEKCQKLFQKKQTKNITNFQKLKTLIGKLLS